ncbi:MAG: hypothetical protein MZV70_55010 [Desulfobacterales bacterium]|nr:hypothetical protein [Desulfobacterales bacterium]
MLKLLDERSHEAYFGCNQEWYATEWQRLSGCGPAAACNMIFYLNNTRPTFGLGENSTAKIAVYHSWKRFGNMLRQQKKEYLPPKCFMTLCLIIRKQKD